MSVPYGTVGVRVVDGALDLKGGNDGSMQKAGPRLRRADAHDQSCVRGIAVACVTCLTEAANPAVLA